MGGREIIWERRRSQKSLLSAVSILALPTARRAFGWSGVHLGVVSLLAELRVGLLLQFQRRRDVETLVSVHENNLAAGPHETQQQRAFARMRGDKLGHGIQLFMRPGGEIVFVDTNERFNVAPSLELQQEADARFGEETYYAKVDTSLPERQSRWPRKMENGNSEG